MASTGFIVDMDNFGNGGRQLRLRCSHTRLLCTLFWLPWFRASRQPKNLEADRVQPVSTVSKPPTGTAEERVMCGFGSVLSGLAGLEALMGNKDKGGRNTKKQATRSLKQKRAEKKAKREAVKGKPKSGPF